MKIERLPNGKNNEVGFMVSEIEGALSNVYTAFSCEPICGYENKIKTLIEKARINNTFPFKLDENEETN